MPDLVSLSILASSSTTPTLLKTQATICSKSNTTFQTHLPELTRLQEEVKRAVQVRQQEEDWDEVTRNAVNAWTEDIESIWRSYRVSLKLQ
jgi:DNA-binding ferritin-like protein